MAGKKDPSIYDDRSNIGSSEELDEYGVWVKSEPQDFSSAMPDIEELPDFDNDAADGMDLPDFDDTELPAEMSVPETESISEIEFEEIPEDSDLPDGLNPTEVDKDGFTEVSVDDFLDNDGPGPLSGVDIGNLDNIPDFPEELPETPLETKAPAGTPNVSGFPSSDLSNQLLMKIAEELSSIKKELSSLKDELSSVRNVRAESQDVHDASGGGFFDEEDDEKIALTGDELDNILNTANFTEEAGSDKSIGDDYGSPEEPEEGAVDGSDLPLSEKPDLIGEDETDVFPVQEETLEFDGDLDVVKQSGDFKAEPLEEITDDFDISLDLSEDLSAGSTDMADMNEDIENAAGDASFSEEIPVSDDGLDSLREEGFNPMTQADGDISYLEEDPLASVSEDEQIDFSGAVIDEPDLGSRITENPIEDPSIENISIDMDMEEPEVSGTGDEDFAIEKEDTMEIPVMEESLIDDFFPVSGADTAGVPAVEESSEPLVIEDSDESLPIEDFGGFNAEIPAMEESGGSEIPAAEETAFVPENENGIPSNLKQELKTVLSYMDQLLESLPEDKIEEFAKSEYFDTYKKLFEELGLA